MADDLLFAVYMNRRLLHSIYPFDRSGKLGLSRLGMYCRFEEKVQKMIKESGKIPDGDG